MKDPAEDQDGGGATNIEEFSAGTNPLDKLSRFVLNKTPAADGSLRLDFPALAGRG